MKKRKLVMSPMLMLREANFGNCLLSDETELNRLPTKARRLTKAYHSRLREYFLSFSRPRNRRKNDSNEIVYISKRFDQSGTSWKTSCAGAEADPPVSPIEVARSEVNEPIDRAKFSSTPLLPPMVATLEKTKEIQSPLQSPTVAESSTHSSVTSTLVDAPLLHGIPSLPSFSKAIESIHHTEVGGLPSSAELPPLLIGDHNDKWSIQLGHANFTISPQPYIPEVCNAETYRQVLLDWEQARTNWFKHRYRTLEHYGLNSNTYKLTEQKWAEIKAEWKRCSDQAAAEAVKTSEEALPIAPNHSPTLPMPTVHNLDGKFPKLGDEDIVGPMKQAVARTQPSPPREKPLNKLFVMNPRQLDALQRDRERG